MDASSVNETNRAARSDLSRPSPAGDGTPSCTTTACGLAAGLLSIGDATALAIAVSATGAGTLGLVSAALSMAAVLATGGYRRRIAPRAADGAVALLASLALPAAAMAALGVRGDQAGVAVYALSAAALVLCARAVVARIIHEIYRRRLRGEPTLVVGGGHISGRIVHHLRAHPEHGLVPVGLVGAGPAQASSLPFVAIERLDETMAGLGIRCVIVALGSAKDAELIDALRACPAAGAEVRVVPRLFELGQPGLVKGKGIDAVPLPRLGRVGVRCGPAWRAKRVLDVVLSAILLAAAAPVLAMAALAVKATSRGPVLFRQVRVGRGGGTFELLKLRSMAVNDDSDVTWSIRHDDRVTLVGRVLRATSLDELPQLLNVMRGDMSLVGPRPERPHFVERFADGISRYGERHRVPVGLTGLAQVNGLRGDTSIEERVNLDNWYIDNWSFWWDVSILFRTPLAALRALIGTIRNQEPSDARDRNRRGELSAGPAPADPGPTGEADEELLPSASPGIALKALGGTRALHDVARRPALAPMRSVLVTGVSGLIGEATAVHLANSAWRVMGISRGPGERGSMASLRAALPSVQLHRGDLGNSEVAARLCPHVGQVVHLAGTSGVVASFADPLDSLQGNAGPFMNVLLSCRPGTRVVLVSTQLTYGEGGEGRLDEDCPTAPQSPYAAHRLLLEQYGRMYAQRQRLDVVVLRLGNVFGDVLSLDRHRSHGVVAKMLTNLVLDGEARVMGGGTQKVQLIHASDVAGAIETLLCQPVRPGGFAVYNLGGESVAVADIARLLVEGLGRGEVTDWPWPAGMDTAMARDLELDDQRFCRTFDWKRACAVRPVLVQLGRKWRHHEVSMESVRA